MNDEIRDPQLPATAVRPNVNEIERRARAATKGPWSRCTANEGNCPCLTIWSTPLDDSPFCLAPSDPHTSVRIEDWAFVATLDPATALALIANIRTLHKALSDAITHVPDIEERERLARVLSNTDPDTVPLEKHASLGAENPGILAFIKAHQS